MISTRAWIHHAFRPSCWVRIVLWQAYKLLCIWWCRGWHRVLSMVPRVDGVRVVSHSCRIRAHGGYRLLLWAGPLILSRKLGDWTSLWNSEDTLDRIESAVSGADTSKMFLFKRSGQVPAGNFCMLWGSLGWPFLVRDIADSLEAL